MRHTKCRSRIGIDIAASDGYRDELFRAIFAAVFLIEQMNIQTEILRTWQIIRIGLNTTDYFAEHDTKREYVDTFVITLTFEHFRCHPIRRADNCVSLSISEQLSSCFRSDNDNISVRGYGCTCTSLFTSKITQ